MTTIDSDSESQDSDDGRRFRFEATRKDDTLRLQSQNKRRTEQSKASNYRSRSGDRRNHNRRDYDKGRQQDRDRKEVGDRDRRKNSKERDSRDNKHDQSKSNSKDSRHATKSGLREAKETHESKNLLENDKRTSNNRDSKDAVRNSSNSKEHKNSKDSRSRESKNPSTRALKDTKIREGKDPGVRERETKAQKDLEAKDRDRGPKRSRDVSHERLSSAKHSHRSREKYKSRERAENREKGEKPKEEKGKKKIPRKGSERKNAKRETHSPSKILDQIGSDSESDLGALDPDVGPVMALDTFEDCRELNLSDFDIISDTEGSSSDSPDPKTPAKGPIIKGEILAPHYYGPKITKRVSRRQYERLVRRQAALNTRRLEELYKVNRRSDDQAVARLEPSCNNPSAVSDFLLGPEAAGEHRRSRITEYEERRSDDEDREPEDKSKLRESRARDSSKLYGLEIGELSLDNSSDKGSKKSAEKRQDQLLDCQIYGPSLPPKNLKDLKTVAGDKAPRTSLEKSGKINTGEISSSDSQLSGALNQSRNAVIGPTLPPGLRLGSESLSDSEESSVGSKNRETEPIPASIIGPSLPPHLKRENSNSLPPKAQDSTQRTASSRNSTFGPTLPPNLILGAANDKSESDSEEEDGVLGPLPPDHPAAINDYIQLQLEERANRMKNKLDAKNLVVEKREEWMLELPSSQAANIGLGKRQFRSKAGPDMSDRSSWTDTPADKAKKKQDKLLGKVKSTDPATESERLAIQERDKTMERMAEKHASKKRKESLLEIHKKKLNKKKKKEEKEAKEAGKPTRRPFDRDVDLQANRFDEAQKKSILKKAQLLNDRFSRGESKYL